MIELLKAIKPNFFKENFINKLLRNINSLIKVSLEEDLDESGDVTSDAILHDKQYGSAKIIARQNGIFCGGFVIKMVYDYIDSLLKVNLMVNEGDLLTKNQDVIIITGSIKNILIGERTALNFLARMSGISTLTHNFKKELEGSLIQILDTRKTLPGWRYIDKYAVVVGGGRNHRIGLFDMVLIKENHIAAAGSITNAVTLCRKYLKEKKLKLMIEVETRNLQEVKEALNLGVDRIMLDNMDLDQIKEAVELVNKKVEVEISGGVTYSNIKSYYNTGVDFISIGQLTHSAHAFDYSLLVE